MAEPALQAPERDRLTRRAEIAALQEHMLALPAESQIPIDGMTFHHFATGAYAREMVIPAGAVVIGKIHKTEHIAVLMQGRVTVTTEDGPQTFEGPKVMVCPAGTKRVAYAHTEAHWLAIHAVGEERDLEKIEAKFIAKDFAEIEAPDAALHLVAESAE